MVERKKRVVIKDLKTINLIKEYRKTHSLKETAEYFNISQKTLIKISKENNFKVKIEDRSNEEKWNIINSYNNFGIEDTCKDFNLTKTELKNFLKNENLMIVKKDYISIISNGETFAEFILRLIVDIYGNNDSIRIPIKDGVYLSGSDGYAKFNFDTKFGIGNKEIIFEFGIEEDWGKKFELDINKRLKNEENKNKTFCFITKQNTEETKKNKLIDLYKKKNFFYDVKIIDKQDLNSLLIMSKSTENWLKINLCNQKIDGYDEFDKFFETWKNSTKIPLNEELILSRKYEKEDIDKKLKECDILYIKSNSQEESLLFLISYLKKYNNYNIYFKSQIITTNETLLEISKYSYINSIIVPYIIDKNPNYEIMSILSKKTKIIIPIGNDFKNNFLNSYNTIYLENITQEGVLYYFKNKFNIINYIDLINDCDTNLKYLHQSLLKINNFKIDQKDLFLNILPFYRWGNGNYEQQFIKDKFNKTIKELKENNLILERENNYCKVYYVSNFIQCYNFDEKEIESILDKIESFLLNEVLQQEDNKYSNYLITGVFNIFNMLYKKYNYKYVWFEQLFNKLIEKFINKNNFELLINLALIDIPQFLTKIDCMIKENEINNIKDIIEIFEYILYKYKNYDDRVLEELLYLFYNKNIYEYFEYLIKTIFMIDNKNILNSFELREILEEYKDKELFKNIIFEVLNAKNVVIFIRRANNELYPKKLTLNNSIKQYFLEKYFNFLKKEPVKFCNNINLLEDKDIIEKYISLLNDIDFNKFDNESKNKLTKIFKENIKYLEYRKDNDNIKKLEKICNKINIDKFEKYVIYFSNINHYKFYKDKDLELKTINELDKFLRDYDNDINKFLELYEKINEKYLFKILAKTKINKTNTIKQLFGKEKYHELFIFLNYLDKENIFNKAFDILDKNVLFIEKVLSYKTFDDEVKKIIKNNEKYYWENCSFFYIEDYKIFNIYLNNTEKYNKKKYVELCLINHEHVNNIDLIFKVLKECTNFNNDKIFRDDMFSYYLESLFEKLYSNEKFCEENINDIIDIEKSMYSFIKKDNTIPEMLKKKFQEDYKFYYDFVIEYLKNNDKLNFDILNKIDIKPNFEWFQGLFELVRNNKDTKEIYRYIGIILYNFDITDVTILMVIKKYYKEANKNIKYKNHKNLECNKITNLIECGYLYKMLLDYMGFENKIDDLINKKNEIEKFLENKSIIKNMDQEIFYKNVKEFIENQIDSYKSYDLEPII